MKIVPVFLFILIYLVACHTTLGSSAAPHLENAEKFAQEGKFEDAIKEYRIHMNSRLKDKTRPDWENPHFYLLLIGDMQLASGNVKAAENSFLEAERNKVDLESVNDRLRTIATFYEKRRLYSEALAVLERYRTRDQLLFDGMADRIAKKMSAEEELRP